MTSTQPRGRAATYFAADLVAIALFALLARAAHRSDTMPFSFMGWLETLWPFALGVVISWAVVVAAKVPGRALFPGGVLVWLITVITGLGIWGIRHGAVPHISFIIVASSVSFVLLMGWRGVMQRRGAPAS